MAIGGIAELFLGVRAEQQSLEDIAKPITAEEAERGRRGRAPGAAPARTMPSRLGRRTRARAAAIPARPGDASYSPFFASPHEQGGMARQRGGHGRAGPPGAGRAPREELASELARVTGGRAGSGPCMRRSARARSAGCRDPGTRSPTRSGQHCGTRSAGAGVIACRVLGHRLRFWAERDVMRWDCDRECGLEGEKRYPTAADAQRYALVRPPGQRRPRQAPDTIAAGVLVGRRRAGASRRRDRCGCRSVGARRPGRSSPWRPVL